MFQIMPCPHCGGYPIIVKTIELVYIECVSCGAKSRAEEYEKHPRLTGTTFSSAFERCVESWNERIQPVAVKKEPETNFEKLLGMSVDEASVFLLGDGASVARWCSVVEADECPEDCGKCLNAWLRKKLDK